jgi:predicted ATPase/DNA-binding CsgD family transcriptional regulator
LVVGGVYVAPIISGGALPALRTPLIGRAHDLASLSDLVLHTDERLLTLTGVGGCGKTRLAVQLASDLAPAFSDRLWLVELAPIADPALVPGAVIATIGLRDAIGRSSVETLTAFLSPQPALLVLDNCEHLIDSCAVLVDHLLSTCPTLRILATSREPLQIIGERQYRLAPLAVPNLDRLPAVDALGCSSAVQLFVARAKAVMPTFALTQENAAAVAGICARLDGIPLALELAAAWARSLAPAQILARLDGSFRLLVGGSRIAPTRQQTLQAALDWSDALLTEEERALFHRLAVFAGEFTLDAIEGICAGDSVAAADVLLLLTRLVDKSLVQVTHGQERVWYRLLEPVRQYARQHLSTRGDIPMMRQRHAAYYLAFAEEAAPALRGPEQDLWLVRLERGQGNLRAALTWAEEAGEWEIGLRMATALFPFWEAHTHITEGLRWLRTFLAAPPDPAPSALRARALNGAGRLAYFYEDGPGSQYPEALALQNESLALAREVGDRYVIAAAVTELGLIHRMLRDAHASMMCLEEGLAIFRELNDGVGIAWALANLGTSARLTGDYARSMALLQEGVLLYRTLGDVRRLAITQTGMGLTALKQGELAQAAEYFAEALGVHLRLGDRWFAIYDMMGIAEVLILQRRPEETVRLLGAAYALEEVIGSPVGGVTYAHLRAKILPLLSEERFEAIHAEGAALTLAQAAALALSFAQRSDAEICERSNAPPPPQGNMAPAEQTLSPLTRREREIAALLARGYTDRQIAETLFLTAGTVGWHVHRILQKLDLPSRREVAGWLEEHEP